MLLIPSIKLEEWIPIHLLLRIYRRKMNILKMKKREKNHNINSNSNQMGRNNNIPIFLLNCDYRKRKTWSLHKASNRRLKNITYHTCLPTPPTRPPHAPSTLPHASPRPLHASTRYITSTNELFSCCGLIIAQSQWETFARFSLYEYRKTKRLRK